MGPTAYISRKLLHPSIHLCIQTQVLRSNWYETAEAVASMTMVRVGIPVFPSLHIDMLHLFAYLVIYKSQAEADALKVPFRLCKQLQKLLIDELLIETELEPQPGIAETNLQPAAAPVMAPMKDINISVLEEPSSPLPETSGRFSAESICTKSAVEPDMMLRCAPSQRYGHTYSNNKRTSTRKRLPPYAIKPDEMSPHLTNQMAAFRKFCLQRHFGAQQDPICESTFKNYEYQIR